MPKLGLDDADTKRLQTRDVSETISGSVQGTHEATLRIVEIDPIADAGDRNPHHHEHMDEVIFVLSGAGTAWEEGETFEVEESDTVFFPKGKRHMIANHTDEPLRLACFFADPDIERDFVRDEETTFPVEEL
jgi:mannose-6-phosphate isomerase-like protein (cupin superfamily)